MTDIFFHLCMFISRAEYAERIETKFDEWKTMFVLSRCMPRLPDFLFVPDDKTFSIIRAPPSVYQDYITDWGISWQDQGYEMQRRRTPRCDVQPYRIELLSPNILYPIEQREYSNLDRRLIAISGKNATRFTLEPLREFFTSLGLL